MPVKSYGFAIGNLRARENTLLKRGELAQLAALTDAGALADALCERGFGDRAGRADVPQLLRNEEERLWRYLYDIVPDEAVFRPFLLQNDYHNLKAALKSLIRGVDPAPLLLTPGVTDPGVIVTAVRDKRPDLLPDGLRAAAERGYEILTSSGDAQLCDGVIDAACMTERLKLVRDKHYGCRLAAGMIEREVFFENFKTAIRSARVGKSGAFLDETLVENAGVEKAALKNAALGGVEQVLELLAATGATGAAAAEAFKRSPSDYERFSDDSVTALARGARLVTMGVEPVIGYYAARRAELKNIRIIYSAIRTGRPEEETLGRLRELYG